MKPVERSRLRLTCGKYCFTCKRYAEWYFGFRKFAASHEENLLHHCVFTHRTPLFRKLKAVDMWLQHNKITNLRIALSRLDGLVIRPGETFSYWKSIGKPTKRKGYVPGMVLFYGKFGSGTGGGLCQLSNLIYWITLHTPLTVVERHRHGYDVFPDARRTQPFGSGATCYYNYIDLRIKNETAQSFQLHLTITDSHLVGEWRSDKEVPNTYQVYEKEHAITFESPFYVRHNLIFRHVIDRQDQVISDEYVTENHAVMMYEPLLEQGGDEVQGGIHEQ